MRGSFNKVVIIKNKVLKVENIDSSFSKKLKEQIDSNKYKKYYKELKKAKIDVATLYLNFSIFGSNVQLEEYIRGTSLQEYIENRDINIDDKLIKMKQLIDIYKKTLTIDACLDLNMKNFIISDNRLVYIDFTPSIYKSKIKCIKNRTDYLNSYLDSELAIGNLINYFLRAVLYLDKDELKKIILELKLIIYEKLKLDLVLEKNIKCSLIIDYIEEKITKEEYEYKYQKVKRI